MYKITLLRHGESVGNADRQIQGQIDTHLTKRGLGQAKRLAKTWHKQERRYDLIIASPLERALGTAEIIGNQLGLPIEVDPAWIERGFGDIEGRVYQDLNLNFYHPYAQMGGSGESLVELSRRASLALQSLLRRPVGAYLVVSHGALLNRVLSDIMGFSPHSNPYSPRFVFSNTGFVDLTYNPENHHWKIFRFVSIDPDFPN